MVISSVQSAQTVQSFQSQEQSTVECLLQVLDQTTAAAYTGCHIVSAHFSLTTDHILYSGQTEHSRTQRVTSSSLTQRSAAVALQVKTCRKKCVRANTVATHSFLKALEESDDCGLLQNVMLWITTFPPPMHSPEDTFAAPADRRDLQMSCMWNKALLTKVQGSPRGRKNKCNRVKAQIKTQTKQHKLQAFLSVRRLLIVWLFKLCECP